MGENFYIFKNGRLQRKDNNVEVVSAEGEKKNLKIEMLEAIYLFGEMDLNTKVLNFLAQNKVLVHFLIIMVFIPVVLCLPRKMSAVIFWCIKCSIIQIWKNEWIWRKRF